MFSKFESNDELVDYLVDRQYIETERVEKAFRNVERSLFVPEDQTSHSYSDNPVPIGFGATISAPHMVAINTELLAPEDPDRILEIGSGSGYQLAILAEMAEKAVGIELIEELVQQSRRVLKDWRNTEIIHGEGIEAAEGSFDRILFSCAVDRSVIEDAQKLLEHGGVVVAPVKTPGGQVLKKFQNGSEEEHGQVRFVDYRDPD